MYWIVLSLSLFAARFDVLPSWWDGDGNKPRTLLLQEGAASTAADEPGGARVCEGGTGIPPTLH